MFPLKGCLVDEVLNGKSDFYLYKLLRIALSGSGNCRAVLFYRIGKNLYDSGFVRVASFFFKRLERNYGVYISKNAEIEKGLKLPHPTGIVIGDSVKIGRNVTIFQQVTLGGTRIGDAQKKLYPRVEDNCVLFAGAKILGKIRIGKNCTVGANAVVIKNVPDYAIAVGIPAKNIIKNYD